MGHNLMYLFTYGMAAWVLFTPIKPRGRWAREKSVDNNSDVC